MQGVDESALSGKGYGETNPVATNDTEEGRFRNRRIQFTVVELDAISRFQQLSRPGEGISHRSHLCASAGCVS